MNRGLELLNSTGFTDLTGASRSKRQLGQPMGVVATGRFAHEPIETTPEPLTKPASTKPKGK